MGGYGEDHADGGRAQSRADEGDRDAHQNDTGADGDVFQRAVVGIVVFLKLGDDGGTVVAEREDVLLPLKLLGELLQRIAEIDVRLRVVGQFVDVFLRDVYGADVLDEVFVAVQRGDEVFIDRVFRIAQKVRVVHPGKARLGNAAGGELRFLGKGRRQAACHQGHDE